VRAVVLLGVNAKLYSLKNKQLLLMQKSSSARNYDEYQSSNNFYQTLSSLFGVQGSD